MKIAPYVEKLNNSAEYKKFKNEYKDAFLAAGFFIIDLEAGNNIHQIDYYIPSKKKIAAFTLDNKVIVQVLDVMNEKVPEELDLKTKIDLSALQGILQDEMKNRNVTEEIKKIVAVIQKIDGKKVWVLNCILSGMEILKAHIDDDTQTVLSMDTASVMDYIKKIPMQQGLPQKSASKDDLNKQIEQLEKLKQILQQEKDKTQKTDIKKLKEEKETAVKVERAKKGKK